MSTTVLSRRAERPQGLPWDVEAAPVEQAIAAAIGHLNARRPADAIKSLMGLQPTSGIGHPHASLVGRVLMVADAYPAALDWFDAALAAKRDSPETLIYRADALAKLDRLGEAAGAFEAAFREGVHDPVAYYNHGAVLGRMNRHAEALVAYDAALKRQPAYPEAWRAAGTALGTLGDAENALVFLDQALALKPDYRDAVLDRANLLHGLGRYEETLATYDAALAHLPGEALLWNNRSIVLHDLGRMAEARFSAESAIDLDPLLAQAHLNLGNVLVRLGDYEAAIESCTRSMVIRPVYPDAECCRGVALKLLGRFDDARASFETALAQDPACNHARANLGKLRLLLGQFERGWPDYEYRFLTERQTKPALRHSAPQWQGRHRPGDRIVVFADRDDADTLQFARFLPRLAALQACVTFICPPRLQAILRGVTGAVEVKTAVEAGESFAFQIALSSLPGVFRTTLKTLAGAQPYLQAEPERVALWAARLAGPGLKLGLDVGNRANTRCDPNHSLQLARWAPLVAVSGLRLISLQPPDETDTAALPFEMFNAASDLGHDTSVDMAALIMSLDLVITSDTAIAHLAGALGRPVWVLLRAVPEWRWMLGRDTSPWYPAMRLFRQTRPGDWTAPVDAVLEALRRLQVEYQDIFPG